MLHINLNKKQTKLKCQPVAYINRLSEKSVWPTERRVSWKLAQCVHMGRVQRSVGSGGWSAAGSGSWSAAARLNEWLWSCVRIGLDCPRVLTYATFPATETLNNGWTWSSSTNAIEPLIRRKRLHSPDLSASDTSQEDFSTFEAWKGSCRSQGSYFSSHLIWAWWAFCTSLSSVDGLSTGMTLCLLQEIWGRQVTIREQILFPGPGNEVELPDLQLHWLRNRLITQTDCKLHK